MIACGFVSKACRHALRVCGAAGQISSKVAVECRRVGGSVAMRIPRRASRLSKTSLLRCGADDLVEHDADDGRPNGGILLISRISLGRCRLR